MGLQANLVYILCAAVPVVSLAIQLSFDHKLATPVTDPDPDPTAAPTPAPPTPAPTPESEPIDLCNTAQEYNNLGFMGPTSTTGVGAQSVIKFKHITGANSNVDMIIANISTYTPDSVESNGSPDGNCFGEVNVKCGTSVQLRFSFADSTSGAAVTLSKFDFTLADIDQGVDGNCKESVIVDGYSDYAMRTDTEIVKSTSNGAKTFTASVHGTEFDNPSELQMSDEQERRAVSFLFENIQSFVITFATEAGGYGGRKVSFAGKTSVSSAANYANSQ